MPFPANAAYKIQRLWTQFVKLDKSGDGPPWPITVYNTASGDFETIGGLEWAVWDWQGRLVLDASGALVTTGS